MLQYLIHRGTGKMPSSPAAVLRTYRQSTYLVATFGLLSQPGYLLLTLKHIEAMIPPAVHLVLLVSRQTQQIHQIPQELTFLD